MCSFSPITWWVCHEAQLRIPGNIHMLNHISETGRIDLNLDMLRVVSPLPCCPRYLSSFPRVSGVGVAIRRHFIGLPKESSRDASHVNPVYRYFLHTVKSVFSHPGVATTLGNTHWANLSGPGTKTRCHVKNTHKMYGTQRGVCGYWRRNIIWNVWNQKLVCGKFFQSSEMQNCK